MKYVRKPVIVDAIQWTGTNLDDIKDFCGIGNFYLEGDMLRVCTSNGYRIVPFNYFIVAGDTHFNIIHQQLFNDAYEEE